MRSTFFTASAALLAVAAGCFASAAAAPLAEAAREPASSEAARAASPRVDAVTPPPSAPPSIAGDATSSYADVEYDEDPSLDATPSAPISLTPWNDGDPERPAGFPKTFLYRDHMGAQAACSNVFDLYAAPRHRSPTWALLHGCFTSADGAEPDEASAATIVAFLEAHVPGHGFQPMWTPASWSHAEAGGDTDAPAWSWEIVTTLIDARKPFVAATSWSAAHDEPTPRPEHFVTVADYAVRDGRPYVLVIHYGHYKWYPYLDKRGAGPEKLGFHARWRDARHGTGAAGHPLRDQKYFRIRPDEPVAPDVWARWHTR